MKKTNLIWSIEDLLNKINLIEFPEFQREPTVWKLIKKQRLIDSIFRDFDIAPIYLFNKGDGSFDCIDGRQRINAIKSYCGVNNDSDAEDNGFHLIISNEIFYDEDKFQDIVDKRFEFLKKARQNQLKSYKINIVEIDKVDNEEELNLLFLRLQLGAVLNAGEKLHAMTGDMRRYIFDVLSKHTFFQGIKIPYRRYAKEQVAAQITLNYFSNKETGYFQRSRYIDLQDFFKERSKFQPKDESYIKGIENTLDIIKTSFDKKLHNISNRAIAVSVFLFVDQLVADNEDKLINSFTEFLLIFLRTLKWQLPKGVKMDEQYYDLLRFQNSVSQAAGEKSAIEKRHDFLGEYFSYFKNEKVIRGDKEYKEATGKNPDTER